MAASDYIPTAYPGFGSQGKVNNWTSKDRWNAVYMNCLDARRWACEHLRKLAPSMFGDLQVYLNDDLNNATAEGGTENGSE